jgi:hypothetical protein
MEEVSVTFGQYSVPVILTVLLSLVYKFTTVPDKWKSLIAVVLGIGLGLAGIAYKGMPWSAVNIIDHVIYGLLMGASATGLYELQRTVRNPRS